MREILIQGHYQGDATKGQDLITLTNSETENVDFMFTQNDYKTSKTDGVISVIVYPTIVSGSSATLAIDATPLDEEGVEITNAADHLQAVKAAFTFVTQVKGTDGGYLYAIIDMPKCWGLRIALTQAGTQVTTAIVGLQY